MLAPKQIPNELLYQYTLFGLIPVLNWYFSDKSSLPLIYETNDIVQYIQKVKKRECGVYGKTDAYLYCALEKYSIKHKRVAIIGSESVIYESICLAYGGEPTTIDYNKRISNHPDLKTMTVKEYERNPVKFDMAISISSIEHDGLGRYGDTLNPNGDIIAMHKLKDMIKLGGIVFLAVPIGLDMLVWNAHRIYGKLRFPLLIGGWNFIDSFGFDITQFNQNNPTAQNPKKNLWQPVFVLQNF